ncbi:homeobox-leucine zipper protein ROC8 [Malania oleifera]|uniref:homeobox-leucine zipper protein ROC8 n=1 Tax=Malania oleifera TaxID=397392 RepID=UPI0025AE341F|nr:homeobox-leucine zipper protein ROC8 [Malania oleifera]
MDFGMGVGSRSSGDQEASNSQKGKKSYHRHTAYQIQRLEAFFKECPHPDENQRKQLGKELGLEPRQIKFWFQNKRTQTKTQNERADNSALRMENEKIQCENLLMRESLKNIVCSSCGGPQFGEEEQRRNVQKLQLENTHLKEEHEKVSNLLAKYIGKPIAQIQSLPTQMQSLTALGASLDISTGCFASQGMGSTSPDIDLLSGNANSPTFPYQSIGISEMEKSLIIETVSSARDELIRLIRINEPLWIKSSTNGNYVLHHDSYEKMFPRGTHFKGSNTQVESSKEWVLVPFSGKHLVDMFLDPINDKCTDLFPSIITKARTIQSIESGTIRNLGGSLQLVYEQMHILSPLVPPREFYFLRYCQQMEQHLWVIVDVSYDFYKENQHFSPSYCWKLPSGCMIEEMANGDTRVTWVEHVEVDDKCIPKNLYRDIVSGCLAFGAEHRMLTLQRMCERFIYTSSEILPTGGVITALEGKRSIMDLAHRMVKNFCSNLNMSSKLDFPQLSELNNNEVQLSIRKSIEPGQPNGLIVSAASSLWLPLPPQTIFNFFTDEKQRPQWDVLSNGNPVQEIAHIIYGTHPGNHVSIIRPFVPSENNLMMLQESCIDPMGSLVIYAPIDLPTLNIAISGGDSSSIPILPSGFIISSDGHYEASSTSSPSTSNRPGGGSLLTVAFQILVCSLQYSKQLNIDSVATVHTLICTTVQRIKAALNCSPFD